MMALVHDHRAAFGNCFIALPQQHFLVGQIPIVKDVSHHHDIGFGQVAVKEAATLKYHTSG